MYELRINIKKHASMPTPAEITRKVRHGIASKLTQVVIDDVVEVGDLIAMRTPDEYMFIVNGKPKILSIILNALINMRPEAKRSIKTARDLSNKAKEIANGFRQIVAKMITVNTYGSTGTKHSNLLENIREDHYIPRQVLP